MRNFLVVDTGQLGLVDSWWSSVQGDHSGCVKPPVNIKTKVVFYYIGLVLKHNFGFDVNGRFDTT